MSAAVESRRCRACPADISHTNWRVRYCASCRALLRKREQRYNQARDDHVALMLPSQPLAEMLRARLARDRNLEDLARRYSSTWGGQPSAASRQLFRVISGEQRTVTLESADRWAIALGYHIDNIWTVSA